MQSFLARIPTLCARFELLAGETVGIDVDQLYAEALNVVRGATSRLVTKWHGEGIRDVDADRLEQQLLALGQALKTGPDPQTGTRAELVADFLVALHAYSETAIEAEFRLLRAGARLLIGLAGPESYFGLFAQLDLYVVLDKFLARDEYLAIMKRLADQADPLSVSRPMRELIARLNEDRPEADHLPTATRFRSYALGNLIVTALDTAAAAETPLDRDELIQIARDAVLEVATRDSAFECLRWYQLALAAVASERAGNDRELREVVGRVGEIPAFEIIEQIDYHFDRPNMVRVLRRVPALLSLPSRS